MAALPPHNEHLTRDVGGLSLALAVLTAAAALTLDRRLVVVAALALLGLAARPRATTVATRPPLQKGAEKPDGGTT